MPPSSRGHSGTVSLGDVIGAGRSALTARLRRHRHLTAVAAVVLTVAGTLAAVTVGGEAGAATAPTKLMFTTQPGDGVPGTALGTQPVVALADSNGATVDTDATVGLTLTGPGGADLTRTASPTCTAPRVAVSGGTARFAGCTLDRGGIFSVTAVDSAHDLRAVSRDFFVSGPAQLLFSAAPGGGTAGSRWSKQPEITVADARGATVPTASGAITLGVTAGTGTAGATLRCATTSVTPTGGVARFSGCAIDRSGLDYRLTALDTGNLLAATSCTFTVNSGPAAKLAFTTQPADAAGG